MGPPDLSTLAPPVLPVPAPPGTSRRGLIVAVCILAAVAIGATGFAVASKMSSTPPAPQAASAKTDLEAGFGADAPETTEARVSPLTKWVLVNGDEVASVVGDLAEQLVDDPSWSDIELYCTRQLAVVNDARYGPAALDSRVPTSYETMLREYGLAFEACIDVDTDGLELHMANAQSAMETLSGLLDAETP